MNEPNPNQRRRRSQLVPGLFLLLIGGVLLAANLGVAIPWHWFFYWPFLLMVPGFIGLIMPSRHLSRSSGLWLFVTGLYCQIGFHHWFGLGWGSAWPLFIIAAGMDLILFKGEQKRNEASREL